MEQNIMSNSKRNVTIIQQRHGITWNYDVIFCFARVLLAWSEKNDKQNGNGSSFLVELKLF